MLPLVRSLACGTLGFVVALGAQGMGHAVTRLWMMQAERDRLHPAVMGYAYGTDDCVRGIAPGAWDAVSDLLHGPERGLPERISAIVGGPGTKAFLAFARSVAILPDPAAAIGGGVPSRALSMLSPGIGFAHVVRLVRHACRHGADPALADRMFRHALDALPHGLVAWAGDLAIEAHGLRLDVTMPSVARYAAIHEKGKDRHRVGWGVS